MDFIDFKKKKSYNLYMFFSNDNRDISRLNFNVIKVMFKVM